jgi:hypothetical protein
MRANETVIFQVRRHPIGLLGIHIAAGMLLLVFAVIIYGVLPNVLTNIATSKIVAIGTLAFVVLAALVFGFLAITHRVYWGNMWILTDDSLTQVSQLSLFDKQSSQLSLASLEDVTVEQNGILPHMFNFGQIKAETAGEHSKFTFSYCPNPNQYARQILEARENFEQGKTDNYGRAPESAAATTPVTAPPAPPAQ